MALLGMRALLCCLSRSLKPQLYWSTEIEAPPHLLEHGHCWAGFRSPAMTERAPSHGKHSASCSRDNHSTGEGSWNGGGADRRQKA